MLTIFKGTVAQDVSPHFLCFFKEVKAELSLHPPHLPWSHSGPFDSLDHASIRSKHFFRIHIKGQLVTTLFFLFLNYKYFTSYS